MKAEFAMELFVPIDRYTVGCVIAEHAGPRPERDKLDAAASSFPLHPVPLFTTGKAVTNNFSKLD